jgi:hypothetical protein
MRNFLASAGLLLCLGALALAAPPTSRVTIHVASAETGRPVELASVIVRLEKGRSPLKLYKKSITTWETRTNQEGSVTLPSIFQGTIRVQVIAPNFQTYGKRLEVDRDEQTIDVKLNPPQAQYTVK